MQTKVTARRRRIPWRRRLLFVAVALGFLAVLTEALSYCAFSLLQGQWFSHAAVRAEQRAIATASMSARPEQSSAGFLAAGIHPYLGYGPAATRLDRLARAADPQDFRILILGGSVANNFFDHGRGALSAILERNPALSGRKVTVERLAFGGYKQPQQLLALTYLLALGARFDAVVNLDGFNDIVLPTTDNLPVGVHPFFPRAWQQIANVHDPELRRRTGEVSWLRGLRRRWAKGFVDSSVSWSVTMQLIWKARDHLLTASIADRVHELQSFTTTHASANKAELDGLGFSGDEGRARMAEFWMDCSIEMHRLCTAYGIRYLHFLQPNQYAGRKPMQDDERRVAIVESHMYAIPARDGYPYLRALAGSLRAAGVRFTDLTDLYDDEPRPVYTDGCCHLNELGCTLIAQRVAGEMF